MRALGILVLLIASVTLAACASIGKGGDVFPGIGQNSFYTIKHKSDLVNIFNTWTTKAIKCEAECTKICNAAAGYNGAFYNANSATGADAESNCNVTKNMALAVMSTEKPSTHQCGLICNAPADETLASINKALPELYKSDNPYILSSSEDTRILDSKKIVKGDSVSIIINKIHITGNGDVFFPAEIATIVTVSDGTTDKPKSVIVSYEEGIQDNFDIPINSLLAYATDNYAEVPIRVEVKVIDLDGQDNALYRQIIQEAVKYGKNTIPFYAPAMSAAARVGEVLMDSDKDEVLAKFTFQLYPWNPGSKYSRDNLGVPRIAQGRYLITQTTMPTSDAGLTNSTQFSYSLEPMTVNSVSGHNRVSRENLIIKPWQTAATSEGKENEALSYVVITVSNTPVNSAWLNVIKSADEANTMASTVSAQIQQSQVEVTNTIGGQVAASSKLQLMAIGFMSKVEKKSDDIKEILKSAESLRKIDQELIYKLILGIIDKGALESVSSKTDDREKIMALVDSLTYAKDRGIFCNKKADGSPNCK